jgi:membrane protease YdiL (CAAX protease family)
VNGEPSLTPDSEGAEVRAHQWRARDLAYFVITFIVLFVAVIVLFPSAASETPDAFSALGATLFIQAGLVLMVYVLTRYVYGRNVRAELGWNTAYTRSNGSLVVIGMGLAFTVMVAAALFPPTSTPPIQQLLDDPEDIVFFAAYGALIAPFIEEFIFRGFLFRVFESMFSSFVAVRVTAILFGLVHVLQLWGSWAGILAFFVVGFALSGIRRRTNSLIPPMIVHFSYNGLILAAGIVGTLVAQQLPPEV